MMSEFALNPKPLFTWHAEDCSVDYQEIPRSVGRCPLRNEEIKLCLRLGLSEPLRDWR
jgi:hypothetical protein